MPRARDRRRLKRKVNPSTYACRCPGLTAPWWMPSSGWSWKLVDLCVWDLAGVAPLEWPGGLVVGLDEREHLLGEILL